MLGFAEHEEDKTIQSLPRMLDQQRKQIAQEHPTHKGKFYQ